MNFAELFKVEALLQEQKNLNSQLCTTFLHPVEKARVFDRLTSIEKELHQYGCC